MKTYVFAILFGIFGFVAAFGGWHLYQDHQNLHALINLVVQQQRASGGTK